MTATTRIRRRDYERPRGRRRVPRAREPSLRPHRDRCDCGSGRPRSADRIHRNGAWRHGRTEESQRRPSSAAVAPLEPERRLRCRLQRAIFDSSMPVAGQACMRWVRRRELRVVPGRVLETTLCATMAGISLPNRRSPLRTRAEASRCRQEAGCAGATVQPSSASRCRRAQP